MTEILIHPALRQQIEAEIAKSGGIKSVDRLAALNDVFSPVIMTAYFDLLVRELSQKGQDERVR